MKISEIFLYIFFFFILMYFGKFILLPFFLSLIFYLIIKSITSRLIDLIHLRFKLNLSKVTAIPIMFLAIFIVLYFLWLILKFNLDGVIQKSSVYQDNFEKVISILSNTFINNFLQVDDILNSLDLFSIFTKILNGFSDFAGNFSFIIIFLIFFVVEEKNFIKKIKSIFSASKIRILNKINSDIFYYFQLKTLTSILTGLLTFFSLFVLKNDLAITFGVLSFFLNFIPFVGSILSILIPLFFSIIQFLNFFEPLFTFLCLSLVQIYVGNILEPKLMGKTLNISPLVMIIFLTILGKFWGIAGMFLSVPLLVVILIILSRIKSTRRIAILLSEKGDL